MYKITVFLESGEERNFELSKVVDFEIKGKSIISESGLEPYNFDSKVKKIRGIWESEVMDEK